MKKILLFTFLLAFSASLSAQKLPSANDLKKDGMEAISKENPNLESQIASALMKDEGLQNEAIGFLKSNPKTAESLVGLLQKNEGSKSDLMKAILGDEDLSTAAINYISENPELLEKAMKVIGL